MVTQLYQAQGGTARTIGSWDRTKNSRFALQRLLLVVYENLFVIVCVVGESSTVSRKRPRIDDRLKPGNSDRNVRDLDIKRGFDDQYRVVPASL
jgi:hypothetical protein